MPLLLADFIHARGCKPKCEKLLTLPRRVHCWGVVSFWHTKRNGGFENQSRHFIGAWKCVCSAAAFFLLPSPGRLVELFNYNRSVIAV